MYECVLVVGVCVRCVWLVWVGGGMRVFVHAAGGWAAAEKPGVATKSSEALVKGWGASMQWMVGCVLGLLCGGGTAPSRQGGLVRPLVDSACVSCGRAGSSWDVVHLVACWPTARHDILGGAWVLHAWTPPTVKVHPRSSAL